MYYMGLSNSTYSRIFKNFYNYVPVNAILYIEYVLVSAFFHVLISALFNHVLVSGVFVYLYIYIYIYIRVYRFLLFFWDPWCSSNFVKYKSKYDCVQNFSFLSRILASAFDFKVYIWLTWEKMTIFPNAPYSQKY